MELPHDGHKLEAAGALYIPLTEYKWLNSVTHSPFSIDTPAHKIIFLWNAKMEEEKMEEAFSESEEEMDCNAASRNSPKKSRVKTWKPADGNGQFTLEQ